MKPFALLFLSVACWAQTPCLSGQGPLQDGQEYCLEVKLVSDLSGTYGIWVIPNPNPPDLVIVDQHSNSERWIKIKDGHVETSEPMTMEQAVLLIYEALKK